MPKGNPHKKFASLSKRQKEVLQLFCQGKKYKEIAEELFIEESTVKAHMAGVYERLGLIELQRDERIFQIKSVYCPLFQEQEEQNFIDVMDEDFLDEPVIDVIVDDVSPELDEMISSDEKAIMLLGGERSTMSTNQNSVKTKKSGFRRFFNCLSVLVFLVIILVGGLYIWQNFFSGTEVISQDVIPQAIIPKEYYEVGEWVKEGDTWVRLKEYDIDSQGVIEFDFEVWNKSPNQLLFSWNPSVSFSMIDNTGHSYRLWDPCANSGMDNEVLDSERLKTIRWQATPGTVIFSDEAVFSADVSDLTLTMQDFAAFDKLKFKIPIR